MTVLPGARLGQYEILAAIGAGGMGEVYRARDTQLNREVAIKVLPELFAQDHERLARFTREAQTLAALNHPNIAQIYGLQDLPANHLRQGYGGQEAGSHNTRALVMELVEGEDLSARIARGPIPLADALPIARQIADALEAAHELGIVHRDLKPANVKVRRDGTAKVLDFGLAKALAPEGAGATADANGSNSPTLTSPAGVTGIGFVLGTAAYMAPEQARGMTVDRRADIWAFGAVFYEMLTGRRPFNGNTVSDMIASVIKDRVPLEHLPADVPPPVRALIARCLEKDPKLRLRDIGEARILLSAAYAEGFGAAGPESGTGVATAAPAAATRRLPNRLLMGIAALLAVSLIVSLLYLWRASQVTAGEVVRFDFLPPDTGEVNLTIHPSVSISPDGSTIAYAASSNGVSRLYVRRRDAIDSRQLPGTEEASNPVFSPDGRSVALISGKKLLKAPLDGQATPLATVNDPRGLTWIDTTSIVYAPDAATGLMRVSVNGGEPKAVTTPDTQKGERSHRWPSALPGGQAVLFTVGSVKSPDDYDPSDIEAVTLATGERRVVLRGASMASYAPSGHLLFARGGTLFAAPFDLDARRVTGSGVPIVQGVMGDRTTGAVHYSIASNGTLAYVPGTALGDQHMMAWVDWGAEPPSALQKTTVTRPLDLPKAPYNDPAISPDGSRVAFIQGPSGLDADVWVYDVQRKSVTRLTFDARSAAPSWSADGRTIYYSSIDSSGSKTTFLRKPADGSREPEPLGTVNWRAHLRQVLPGGTAGIVEGNKAGGSERNIHRVQFTPGKAETVALEPIVATRADEYGADVSLDGRWLAYGSDESGRMEVYVRDLSGGGRWQISTGGGEEPHWSADSRRLYYRQRDGLDSVPIDTRNGFSAAMPQLMFRGAYNLRSDTGLTYDVDPRTGGLLMVRPVIDPKTRATIRVVLNWFEELKSKFSR